MIIIFNGPPGSGKDEAANYSKQFGFKHVSFKRVLFEKTCEQFGVDYKWFMQGYEDRKQKEQPSEKLRGFSRRQAMIYTSENVLKPKYGKDYFGVQVANEISNKKDYCISDGGFEEELRPIINKIGTENIRIVQLGRNGSSYENDSRRYFNGNIDTEFVIKVKSEFKLEYILPTKFPIKIYRIHNNGDLSDFYKVLQQIIQKEKALNGTPEEGKIT